MDAQQSRKLRKRTANACQRCRINKIKCSGSNPCGNCSKRRKTCFFENAEPQVTVSKRFISDLKSRVAALEAAPNGNQRENVAGAFISTHPSQIRRPPAGSRDSITPNHQDDSEQAAGFRDRRPDASSRNSDASEPSAEDDVAMTNPLSAGPSNSWFISDPTAGSSIYLGTSSNWSFSRRVLDGASQAVNGAPLDRENFMLDGDVFDLSWSDSTPTRTDGAHTLPSRNHAIYLVRSVQFHVGEIYHLLDDDSFMAGLHQYYDSAIDELSQRQGLWYIQFLLIMAFGKAFVATSNNKDGAMPPGVEHFTHAMRLLPDVTQLWKDPFTAAEVFCCAALYLQCMDFRYAAYLTIGQAVRTALFQGMHTELPQQVFGAARVERARNIWWTVYMLDRELSSLMGLPIQMADENITARFPTLETTEQAIAFRVHVKLCRVIARVVGTVYGPDGRLNKQFLASTRSALTSIADIAGELSQSFALPLDKRSRQGISRMAASLHLWYHHCMILTTRPLMFSLFKKRLDSVHVTQNTMTTMHRLRVLLQMCVDSAQHSLRILSTLRDQGLLGSFLPFDLEAAYCSGIIMLMAAFVEPSLVEGCSLTIDNVNHVFDEFIAHGNLVAKRRKAELQQLDEMLESLKSRPQIQTLDTATPAAVSQADHRTGISSEGCVPATVGESISAAEPAMEPVELTYPLDGWTWEDAMNSSQLMNVADFLEMNSFDEIVSTFDP